LSIPLVAKSRACWQSVGRLKPLVFQLTNGTEHQLQSVGWKTPQGSDCRRQFFALDPERKILVVTPKLALPEFYDPMRQAKAVFRDEPFPEAVCIEIKPCRLLAPPCYQSKEEFDRQLPGHYVLEPWRAFYWDTHREILLLSPSDDGPLKDYFGKWLAAMRAAYQREADALHAQIDHMKSAPLTQLGLDNEDQRDARIKEAEAQLGILDSNNPIEGVPCKGWLNLTFDDIKRGCEGIRDAWMHRRWASENGQDLAEMRREQRVFRRWLEIHTGTPATVFHSTTRQLRYEIMPPNFGERFESDPRFLEACAKVRYRARLADNASTVVYLADCEIREELTAEERKEATKLSKNQKARRPKSWHTRGFTAIRRINGNGEVSDTLPLNNEFRALCQLLSESPDNTTQFSEIEPKIGNRAHELDVAAGVGNPAQKGERRIRDLLQNETGRRLLEWGVLTEKKIGREKFLTLSAPNPA
jgi:hypothetical protein